MKAFAIARVALSALLTMAIASCGGGGGSDSFSGSDPGLNPGIGTQVGAWTVLAQPHYDGGSGHHYFGPQSVAANPVTGDLYVSGTISDPVPADHKLYRISARGEVGDVSGPWDKLGDGCYFFTCTSLLVATGADGRVYLMPNAEPGDIGPGGPMNLGGNFVYVLDASGVLQKTIALGDWFQGPFTVDASGNLYLFKYGSLYRIGQDGHATFVAGAPWDVSLLVFASGVGLFGVAPGIDAVPGHDGVGTQAAFVGPTAMTVDASGNLYVSEVTAVRKVSPAGVVSTLAGTLARFSLQYGAYSNITPADGTGGQARFQAAAGIAFAGDGSLFVLDGTTLRRVTLNGVVTTVGPVPSDRPLRALASFGGTLFNVDSSWNVWSRPLP
jgi:hypothetical protein